MNTTSLMHTTEGITSIVCKAVREIIGISQERLESHVNFADLGFGSVTLAE